MTDRKFRKLVNLYLDKEITAKDLELLKLEIARDPLRKLEFQRSCRIHAAERKILLEKARRQLKKSASTSGTESRSRKPAVISYSRTGSPVRMGLVLGKERRQIRLGRIFSVAAALAVMGIVVAGAMTWLNYEERALDREHALQQTSQSTVFDIEAWRMGRAAVSENWRFLMPVVSDGEIHLVSLTAQELNEWLVQTGNVEWAEQLRIALPKEVALVTENGWENNEVLPVATQRVGAFRISVETFKAPGRDSGGDPTAFPSGYYITPAGMVNF